VSPTGSGKSTTISSLLDFINHTQSKRILTIENPVEYVLQSDRSFCEQQEIGRDTLGYDHALKNVLRAGVDVVMVSRLDTPEVIERTLLVAETGHLVFGTVNTSYAVETINWIVDLFPLARQVEYELA
jgi:twitching motility protein PilT